MPYRDYEEFIGAFNERGARYLMVGAHAVAYHARPRATKDFDVLIDPNPTNLKRVEVWGFRIYDQPLLARLGRDHRAV